MKTELVKVDAKEYGLEESKASQISAQFKPMLDKMEELEKEYNEIMKLPIESNESAERSKEVLKKYVKVRTGTAEIHKEQKAFYLAGGRYVDGWKNAQLFASQGNEENLQKRVKYKENLEKERIIKLDSERKEQLSKYLDEFEMPSNLGGMEDSVWENYLTGSKIGYEARIEAEKKAEAERIENDRLDKVANDRRFEIAPFAQFNKGNHDLRLMSNEDYSKLLTDLKDAKKEYESRQEEQRIENERLKKEAEAKEIALEKERKEAKAKQDAIEAKAKAESDKLKAELKRKQDAEDKAKAEAEATKQAEAKKAQELSKAPVKDKLKRWVDSFELPETDVDNQTEKDIKAKFEAFKSWATKEIKSI